MCSEMTLRRSLEYCLDTIKYHSASMSFVSLLLITGQQVFSNNYYLCKYKYRVLVIFHLYCSALFPCCVSALHLANTTCTSTQCGRESDVLLLDFGFCGWRSCLCLPSWDEAVHLFLVYSSRETNRHQLLCSREELTKL